MAIGGAWTPTEHCIIPQWPRARQAVGFPAFNRKGGRCSGVFFTDEKPCGSAARRHLHCRDRTVRHQENTRRIER